MKYFPLEVSDLRHYELYDNDELEYYSIGDIHGCIAEMKDIHALIQADATSRGKVAFIICHGDMIDRGPAFSEILEFASEQFDLCILGNHEHNFVLERIGGKACNSNSRLVSHERFEAMSEGKQKKAMRFLNSLYNFVTLDMNERTYILTHAPVKDMECFQNWTRYNGVGNAPYFCMRSSVPIDEDMQKLDKNVTFVYGHQSWEFKDVEEQKFEQLGRTAHYYNIDGGTVYGGELIALRLSDLGVIKVRSSVKVAK